MSPAVGSEQEKNMSERTIYKSEAGRKKILELYDSMLERPEIPYHNDIYIDTSFGRTHLVETGNKDGEPLLLFHGGNSTTAYTLLTCGFLMEDLHIYAVDTIGHPGKSAGVSLSAYNYDYGKWAGEVISALGFSDMALFGGSFGAGIVAKTMCAAPEKVKRAVLYIPSGIKNAPQINSISMLMPMMMYSITKKDEWLKKTLMPLALREKDIPDDMFITAKTSIDNTKVKAAMPSDADEEMMKKCKAPALVMAAEKDRLFPGAGVIERAKMIIPNCTAYLLEGRTHINTLTDEEEKMIVDFLKSGSTKGE